MPLAQLTAAVADGADAVAFSAVQMSTGEVADIVGAERGGRLRMSWHVYNDASDVDRALEALA